MEEQGWAHSPMLLRLIAHCYINSIGNCQLMRHSTWNHRLQIDEGERQYRRDKDL